MSKKKTKSTRLENQSYSITGTYHGAIIFSPTEGLARKEFHRRYNGESIVYVRDRITNKRLQGVKVCFESHSIGPFS